MTAQAAQLTKKLYLFRKTLQTFAVDSMLDQNTLSNM